MARYWNVTADHAANHTVTTDYLNTYGVTLPNYLYERPGVRARRTTDQTIPTGTWTEVTLTGTEWDTADLFNATSASVIVPPKPMLYGLYCIEAEAFFASDSTGYRGVRINSVLDGTIEVARLRAITTSAVGTIVKGTIFLTLGADDEMTLEVIQSSGGDLTLARGALTLTWRGELP